MSHDDLIGRAYSVSDNFDVMLNHYLRIASDAKKKGLKLWKQTIELNRLLKGYPTITEKMVNAFSGIIKKYVEKEDSLSAWVFTESVQSLIFVHFLLLLTLY